MTGRMQTGCASPVVTGVDLTHETLSLGGIDAPSLESEVSVCVKSAAAGPLYYLPHDVKEFGRQGAWMYHA